MALAPVLALNYNLEAWNINSDSKSPRTKEHTRDVPDHVTHLTIYRPETRRLGELINVASCKWVRTKQGCSAHSLPTLHGMKTDFLSRAAWLFIYRGATQGFPTSLPTLRKWRESGNSWDSAGHWILNTVFLHELAYRKKSSGQYVAALRNFRSLKLQVKIKAGDHPVWHRLYSLIFWLLQ